MLNTHSDMKAIKKLLDNNVPGFFTSLAPGECFTYSDSFFPQDIVRLASLVGVKVSYCTPKTLQYKTYGTQTMMVDFPPKTDDETSDVIENMLETFNKIRREREYYKNLAGELEGKLQSMKQGSPWKDPISLELAKDEYTSEEILLAFTRAKIYEGLATNKFGTVLDTFIDFLEGKKKSHSV